MIFWFGTEVEPDSPEDLCEDYLDSVFPKPAEVLAW